MTNEQVTLILTFAKEFGPSVASIVGTLFSGVVTLFIFAAKSAWKSQSKRMDELARKVDILVEANRDLAVKVVELDEDVSVDTRKIWEHIQTLRAELEISRRSSDTLKESILRIEGSTENLRSTIYDQIEKLARFDSKFEAVFRFIDAPKRRTDVG